MRPKSTSYAFPSSDPSDGGCRTSPVPGQQNASRPPAAHGALRQAGTRTTSRGGARVCGATHPCGPHLIAPGWPPPPGLRISWRVRARGGPADAAACFQAAPPRRPAGAEWPAKPRSRSRRPGPPGSGCSCAPGPSCSGSCPSPRPRT